MTPNTQRFVASSLPLGWPKTLKMRTELSEDEVQMPSAIRRFTNNNMSSARCLQESEEEELQQASMRASRFAMNPNSRFHMIYSCASLIVLFFDLTVVAACFQYPAAPLELQRWSSSSSVASQPQM